MSTFCFIPDCKSCTCRESQRLVTKFDDAVEQRRMGWRLAAWRKQTGALGRVGTHFSAFLLPRDNSVSSDTRMVDSKGFCRRAGRSIFKEASGLGLLRTAGLWEARLGELGMLSRAAE